MNEKTWKNIKTVNEWLDKDYLPKGYTVANVKFKKWKIAKYSKELSRPYEKRGK